MSPNPRWGRGLPGSPQPRKRRALARVLTTASLVAVALSPLAAPDPAGAQTEVVCTETFDYTGGTESYTVPTGVTSLIVDAWGAQGGDSSNSYGPAAGGRGGHVHSVLAVTPGETLPVSVGGEGPHLGLSGGPGGFGGGGGTTANAAGGGGASDVRQDGSALSDRVVVAGGGGGAGRGEIGAAGGAGGHPAGGKGANSPDGTGDQGGFGGTQTAGGAPGTAGVSYVSTAATAGSFGQGGDGGKGQGNWHAYYGGGGGGGGYYGGGGGKGGSGYLSPTSYADGAGGGGGSSFGPPGSQFVSGVNTGDGKVVFTVVGPACGFNDDWPSQDCQDGPVVVDGFSADGNAYTKLRSQTDSATGEEWVCFRYDGGTAHVGGKLVVSDPTPGSLPTSDDDGEACGANDAPNGVPGPHPLVSGNIGPNNTHVEADVFYDGSEAWVCLVADTVSKRVIVPAAETSGVELKLDSPSQYAFPADWPMGVPSRLCKDQGGSATVDHVNSDLGGEYDSGHAWLTTWTESATRVHLCFRAHTPVGSRGAVITADVSILGGGQTSGVDTDMTPCSVNIVDFTNPVPFFVKVAEPDDNPLSVCMSVNGTQRRAFVGVTGPVAPIVCTEDPGTPNIC